MKVSKHTKYFTKNNVDPFFPDLLKAYKDRMKRMEIKKKKEMNKELPYSINESFLFQNVSYGFNPESNMKSVLSLLHTIHFNNNINYYHNQMKSKTKYYNLIPLLNTLENIVSQINYLVSNHLESEDYNLLNYCIKILFKIRHDFFGCLVRCDMDLKDCKLDTDFDLSKIDKRLRTSPDFFVEGFEIDMHEYSVAASLEKISLQKGGMELNKYYYEKTVLESKLKKKVNLRLFYLDVGQKQTNYNFNQEPEFWEQFISLCINIGNLGKFLKEEIDYISKKTYDSYFNLISQIDFDYLEPSYGITTKTVVKSLKVPPGFRATYLKNKNIILEWLLMSKRDSMRNKYCLIYRNRTLRARIHENGILIDKFVEIFEIDDYRKIVEILYVWDSEENITTKYLPNFGDPRIYYNFEIKKSLKKTLDVSSYIWNNERGLNLKVIEEKIGFKCKNYDLLKRDVISETLDIYNNYGKFIADQKTEEKDVLESLEKGVKKLLRDDTHYVKQPFRYPICDPFTLINGNVESSLFKMNFSRPCPVFEFCFNKYLKTGHGLLKFILNNDDSISPLISVKGSQIGYLKGCFT
jgi:hypothetical protein